MRTFALPRAAAQALRVSSLLALMLSTHPHVLRAQTAAQPAAAPSPEVPDWALPNGPNHKQHPPPADFHRPSRNFDTPIGIFTGQSDIGAALVPSSASFDAGSGQYTINSAGYNIWYTRDEFRFLWKKLSGDVSLAATVNFPVPAPPRDRKVVLVIRQDLDDDSQEVMTAEHGTGMVHLASRATKNAEMKDMEYRISGSLFPATVMPQRIGIQKHGDEISMFISVSGEPMHQLGPPVHVHFNGPFYVGLGFCPHLATTVDTGTFSAVVLENTAGKVR
ncbi:MAG TPA: hypothetical protein VM865_10005 [Acidobacteriaceae bacterium]|nr:hypothetical protein [Acidobacteriaceae bacterium]